MKERDLLIFIVLIVLGLGFLFFSFFPGIVQTIKNFDGSLEDINRYLIINLILSLFGILFASIGYFCAIKHARNYKDTLFFGTKIPMAIIGILMYNFIAFTALEGFLSKSVLIIMLHQFLIIFTGFFTIYLIYKAFKSRLFCPGCIACWIVNTTLIILLFRKLSFGLVF